VIWSGASRLAQAGVLGLNRRNADFISQYNKRRYYPLVDDKLRTKELALAAGIAVPELYGVVEIEHQIRELRDLLAQRNEFVIKPAHGSGGDGILVISGRSRDLYRTPGGAPITQQQLDHHVSNVLSGLFSLGGHSDTALIEAMVHFDPVFQHITFQGVPDIRIIVFLGIPIMAMVRLPTRLSDGKANLHQGAIGAGIDMATGCTLSAVQGNDVVLEHPDTHFPVTGVEIPHWRTLLEIASRCHELTRMGYVGVDLVLDRDRGPLVLELNARPGLNIQIANRCGLLTRLQPAHEASPRLTTADQRVAFAMETFGARP
jgi:alpha-L-glutamate ligase-like protein